MDKFRDLTQSLANSLEFKFKNKYLIITRAYFSDDYYPNILVNISKIPKNELLEFLNNIDCSIALHVCEGAVFVFCDGC